MITAKRNPKISGLPCGMADYSISVMPTCIVLTVTVVTVMKMAVPAESMM